MTSLTPERVPARVTRRIRASRERVFDAWLDPKLIGRFLFGPEVRDEEIVRISLDPVVGGRFSFVVRRHGTEFDHVGEYLELVRPARLSFTWGVATHNSDMSRVHIAVTTPEDDPTLSELTLTHELNPNWADFVEKAKGSWAMMLGKLAAAIEPQAITD